jgi:hypothetical protein
VSEAKQTPEEIAESGFGWLRDVFYGADKTIDAIADAIQSERDTQAAMAKQVEMLKRELECREALIKQHLATILHLENRVDAEAQRAEAAESALREVVGLLNEARGTHGDPCPELLTCGFVKRALAFLASHPQEPKEKA